MKKLTILAALIISTASSCKKDSTTKPANSGAVSTFTSVSISSSETPAVWINGYRRQGTNFNLYPGDVLDIHSTALCSTHLDQNGNITGSSCYNELNVYENNKQVYNQVCQCSELTFYKIY